MKDYLFGISLILIISFNVYLYKENQTLNSRISTLTKKNIKVADENINKFKEDYYIEQQNRDTTLILFTVSTLFLMFGGLTFFGVRAEFKTQIEVIENKHQEELTNYKNAIKQMENLEGDLSFTIAGIIANDSKLYQLEYTKVELSTLFEMTLISCEHYSRSIILKTNVLPLYEKSVKSLISSGLGRLKELAENNDEIELKFINYNGYINLKRNIEKVIDEADSRNLAFIFNKLKFVDLV